MHLFRKWPRCLMSWMSSLIFLAMLPAMQYPQSQGKNILHSFIINSNVIFFHSRYLFVNFRPWAKNAFISDPYNPPPAALSVERVVIDLTKMEVCNMFNPS